ncbi:MAG: archaellin/type IV pilin N-terminal domain-containing protein [Candidatus Pacearchaeota archaeon]
MIKKDKRAISPVIATLLLVVIVIILVLIVFIWAKSFIKESIQKKEKPAQQVCGEIRLEVYYNKDSGEISFSNIGNYPIYSLQLRLKEKGKIKNYEINKSILIGAGESIKDDSLKNKDSIEVIPVILGENEKGKKTQYTCKENTFLAETI